MSKEVILAQGGQSLSPEWPIEFGTSDQKPTSNTSFCIGRRVIETPIGVLNTHTKAYLMALLIWFI